jgi:hypothetical protein
MKCLIAVSIGIAALASATDVLAKHNGNICQPIPGDVSKIGRFHYGVHNTSTTAPAEVWCPIDRRYDLEESGATLRVTMYDRNTPEDVVCTAYVQDDDGDFLDTAMVNSAGNQVDFQTKIFTGLDPVNGNTVVKCTIPPATASGSSHVASFTFHVAP